MPEPKEMSPIWAEVGKTIKEHRKALEMRQEDLARSARISVSKLREIENCTAFRHRGTGTLRSISMELGLHAEYLDEILTGVRTLDKTANEPSLRSISGMLAQIAGRLDAIENLLGKTDTIL
jgi:transcriptional regulator with XRE-family HTH domain